MRIDPGERVVVEVTDYDMDLTPEVDKLKVEGFSATTTSPIVLEAIETEENSGIFRTGIDHVRRRGGRQASGLLPVTA